MLAHSSQRENSDSEGDASKVVTKKRKHSVHGYFRKKTKEIYSASRKVWNSSTKDVNLGTVTNTLPWYKILATQWNPCQTKTSQEMEKNLRKLTEAVAEARSCSCRQFIRIRQAL